MQNVTHVRQLLKQGFDVVSVSVVFEDEVVVKVVWP